MSRTKKTRASEALREVAERIGSQKELADRLGVSRQQVNQWLSGTRQPSRSMTLKLSATYRIPISAWDETIEKETECHN